MSDRRIEVSEAAWRVILREGVDRASLRAIAQELGTTVGVITHHFRNKDELMLLALDRVTAKLLEPMQTLSPEVEGIERLGRMLAVMLPINADLTEILKVWLAFLGYAVGRDELMQEHHKRAAQLKDAIAQEIAALQAEDIISDRINPDIEARNLLAFVNGLAIDAIVQSQPLEPRVYLELLYRQLHAIGK
jgi:AcrR family transcriptional regulator